MFMKLIRPFHPHTCHHRTKGNGNGCQEEIETTALKQGPYGRDLEGPAIWQSSLSLAGGRGV